jgi:hypothetical protein
LVVSILPCGLVAEHFGRFADGFEALQVALAMCRPFQRIDQLAGTVGQLHDALAHVVDGKPGAFGESDAVGHGLGDRAADHAAVVLSELFEVVAEAVDGLLRGVHGAVDRAADRGFGMVDVVEAVADPLLGAFERLAALFDRAFDLVADPGGRAADHTAQTEAHGRLPLSMPM